MSTRSQGNQPPQVVIVQKSSNGCLLTLLATLLFGWLGLAAAVVVALTRWTWRTGFGLVRGLSVATWRATVFVCAVSWRALVAGVALMTPYLVRAGQAVTRRTMQRPPTEPPLSH